MLPFLWLTKNKFTSNNTKIVLRPNFLMLLKEARVSLFGMTHSWGQGKWAMPLSPSCHPLLKLLPIKTARAEGCVPPWCNNRGPSSLSPFPQADWFLLGKINAVAVRFWRSEVDRLQQMRGGAGWAKRQQATTGPPGLAWWKLLWALF